jgi:hypothetical protein
MDFSKAFDKVGHNRLLLKLNEYGITGKLNNWIKAFLSGRTQQVVLEGELSYTADVLSGVPQGSVLGPCLLFIFINDLADTLKSTIRLFADDTIAYLAIKSNEVARTLQEDLDKLGEWETKWQMEFHPDKCHIIRITRNRRNIINSQYHLHGHSLQTVNSAKYLGVTITSDLSWNKHVDVIAHRANSCLAFLRRNLKISSPKIKNTAYKALIRPHLEYASTVWDPYTAKNINRLEAVQRRAARWVLAKHRRGPDTTPVSAMLEQLKWPLLSTRRQNNRLIMLFKIINGLVNINLPTYLQLNIHQHNTRYKTTHSLTIPDSVTSYHKNSYFPRTVRDWNNLPSTITSAPSLDIFKTKISSPQ